MKYLTLTNPAKVIDWARTLVGSLNQREARYATLTNLATYADDAAAGVGGVVSGDFYRTSDGAGGFFVKVKA